MAPEDAKTARRDADARGPQRGVGRPGPLHHRPYRTGASLLVVIAMSLAWPGPASPGQTRYVPFEMFRAWQALVPESPEIRLCGLTRAGHALWAQRQLRVPLSPAAAAVGALMPGQELWAVLLESGDEPAPCDRLLILTRAGSTWQRLLWQRVAVDPGAFPTALLWDAGRGAVLIDTGERKRLTAPATLRWEGGGVVQATPGFVVDVRLVRHVAWWRADTRRIEYEALTSPLEVLDTSEEERP